MVLRVEFYVQVPQRFDRAALAAPLDGTLFEGVVARTHGTGDALQYPSGPEYRDVAELDRIVAQLVGLRVVAYPTDPTGHPEDLLKNGAQARVIGKIVSARRDGNEAVAAIMITDDAALEDIHQNGVKELSLGYETNLDSARFQRGVELDHLSVVTRGRCTGPGGTCALRVDAITQELQEPTMPDENKINTDVKLTAADRHHIPGHLFADPAHKGFPIEDASHVRDAMARFEEAHFASPATKRSVYHRIIARAHELGVDPSGFQKKHEGHMDHRPGSCACTSLANPGSSGQIAGSMPDAPDAKTTLDALQAKLTEQMTEVAAQKARADQAEKDRDAHKARADQAEITAREATKDAKAFEARITDAEAKVAAAETKSASLDAAVEAAKAQAKLDADTYISASIDARIGVLKAADDVLGAADKDGKPIEHAKKSDRDLKIEIARRVDGTDAVLDADSDDAVNASYRGALKRHAAADKSRVDVRVTTQEMRETGAVVLAKTAAEREAEAKQQAASRASEAWKRDEK